MGTRGGDAGPSSRGEATKEGHRVHGSHGRTQEATPPAGRRHRTRRNSAVRTLDLECEGLQALRATLDQQLREPFRVAVATLAAAKGRVIVTGIGKSGHVGQKLAATFASTGTPAFFVHPSEASHGDLGMITREDVIVAMSWSGESVELGNILTYSRRFKVPLIAITSRAELRAWPSSRTWCWSCRAPRRPARTGWRRPPRRPCSSPSAIASPSRCSRPRASPPTTSRCSIPAARWAPASSSSPTSCTRASSLPLVAEDKVMSEALVTMTQKSFGCLGVVDGKGRLVGMITDGDLRRHMGPSCCRRACRTS